MAATPELERHCGSWVIVSRATGKPVLETFRRATAEAVNQDRYRVLTAAQWLGEFNRALKIGTDLVCCTEHDTRDDALRARPRPEFCAPLSR